MQIFAMLNCLTKGKGTLISYFFVSVIKYIFLLKRIHYTYSNNNHAPRSFELVAAIRPI